MADSPPYVQPVAQAARAEPRPVAAQSPDLRPHRGGAAAGAVLLHRRQRQPLVQLRRLPCREHQRFLRRLPRARLATAVGHRPHARPDRRQGAGRHCAPAACLVGTIGDWSLLAALVILIREISVSGLREFLAGLKNVSVPVTRLAKWKTTMQMVAIGFLLIGPAGDRLLKYYFAATSASSPTSGCCSCGSRR